MQTTAELHVARVRQLSIATGSNSGSQDPTQQHTDTNSQHAQIAFTDPPADQPPSLSSSLGMVLQSPLKQQKPSMSFASPLMVSIGEGLPLISKRHLKKLKQESMLTSPTYPQLKEE